MADAIIYATGAVVLACLGLMALAMGVIGLVWMFNRASWWVMNAYGGIKTFNEFRDWYHGERKEAKHG
jgi:hypothetical protein